MELANGRSEALPHYRGIHIHQTRLICWAIQTAINEAVPAPVLSAALYSRFSSRGETAFADKLLSAMRFELGGHQETPAQ